jgi:hypothetical protein
VVPGEAPTELARRRAIHLPPARVCVSIRSIAAEGETMLGRRVALVICAAGAAAFGGGAAFAAVHGGSHHPAKPKPAKLGPASNVRYPCHDHGGGSVAGLL